MILTLNRMWATDKSTIGELYIDGEFQCYTLEDVVREYPNKVPKETAIWEGMYSVTIDFSNRFQKPMPHVLNVPLFEGIRIHSGNTAADTEGCILLGRVRDKDQIFESRLAFTEFFTRLEDAINKKEEVLLIVANPIQYLEAI